MWMRWALVLLIVSHGPRAVGGQVYHLPLLSEGLCNQLAALFAYLLMAHRTCRSRNCSHQPVQMVLPQLSTSCPWERRTTAAFGSVFRQDVFIQAMSRLGIRTLPRDSVPQGTKLKPYTYAAAWAAFTQFERAQRRTFTGDTRLFDAFNLALVPVLSLSAQAQRIVDAFQQHRFGCLHARIEKEQHPVLHTAPSLAFLIKHMQTIPELLRVRKVFVAVGYKISLEDDRLLNRTLPWGAHIVRARDFVGNISCQESAVVALSVCRRASWFVGYGRSSFSLKVAQYRYVDHGEGWYAACPWGISKQHDRGLRPLSCMKPALQRRPQHSDSKSNSKVT